MANEFKIKKGLIVTGASGGTVVDIQGSQGQLFSVTDDLSGSIFAVSDISGIPILDVNSSGISYFDGSLGVGTDSPKGKLHVLNGTAGTYTPDSESDTLVIESATPGGISLIGTGTGSASKQSITFGTTSDTTSARIIYNSNSSFLSIGTTTASNFVKFVSGNGVTALTLDATQNATFAGTIGSGSITSTGIITAATTFKTDSGSMLFFVPNVGQAFEIAQNTGDATFAAQAFSTATSSGDASSTLTTKGYVDGLITGATIYRGAWDPSGGGYGSPDLSTVTQTSGYYYICSAAGTAEPNGTGTEPDTWAVGDWVIYNDVSGTGQWQKIDNSSVLSGAGTGQTVALWEGAGSVTDSETLGNAPITVSGNDTIFAGSVSAEDNIYLTDAGTVRAKLLLNASDRDNVELRAESLGSTMKFFTVGTEALELDASQNATFAGDVYIPEYIYHSGDTNTYIRFTADTQTFRTGGDDRLILTNTTATFAGAIGVGGTTPSNGYAVDITPSGGNIIRSTRGTSVFGSYQSNNSDVYLGTISNNTFKIITNDTVALTLDTSQNATFAGDVSLGLNYAVSFNNSNDKIGSFTNGDVSMAARNNIGIYADSDGGGDGVIDFHTGDAINAGSPKMTILNNGNVGIGTTSPDSLLEISKAQASGPILKLKEPTQSNGTIEGGPGNNLGVLGFVSADGSTSQANLIRASIEGQPGEKPYGTGGLLTFNTMQTYTGSGTLTDLIERMRIDSSGNVGIGTTNPSAFGKFVVSGSGNLLNLNATSGKVYQAFYENGAGRFYLNTLDGSDGLAFTDGDGATERMRIDSNGNVGIGTTSPGSRRLSVVKDTGITAGFNDITEFLDTTLGGGGSVSLNVGRENSSKNLGKMAFKYVSSGSNSNALNFGFYDADNLMTIQAGGNVGIGTTSPNQKLEVSAFTDTTISIASRDTSLNAGQNIGILEFASNNETSLSQAYTAFSKIKGISESAVSGTGSVNGAITFETASANVFGEKMRIASDGAIKFNTYGAGTLVSDASGNITVSSGGGAGGPYLPLAGGTMTGTNGVLFPDNFKLNLGAGSDLQIYHDGTNSYINDTDTGDLYIQASDNMYFQTYGSGKRWITLNENASVDLFYNDSKKFETTNTGVTVTGAVAVNGSYLTVANASNPYIYVNDTNAGSGIFQQEGNTTRIGSDSNTQVVLVQNNATAVTIDTSKNVGIGTTSPAAKLHVMGTTGLPATSGTTFTGTMRLGVSGGYGTVMDFGGVGPVTGTQWIQVTDAGDQSIQYPLLLQPNGGNVGIGTTSPSVKLDVNGEVLIASGEFLSWGTSGTTAIEGSTVSNKITFRTQSTERMRITSSGNVGIGTTSPSGSGWDESSTVLHLYKNSTSGGLLALESSNTKAIINAGNNQLAMFTTTGDPIRFGTNGSERMRIDSSGNVGIGATAPLRKLHVVGNFAVNAATDQYYGVNISGGEGSDPKITIGDWHNSGSTLQWDSSARSLNLDTQYSTSAGTFNITGNDGASTFLTILPSGNVGIGTTSPGAKLEIAGFSTGQGLKMNYGNSSGTIEAVNFIANGGANGVIGMQMVSAGVGDLWLGGSNGRSLTLYRDGNVGIGTSTPNAKLDVQGTQGQLFSVTDDLSGDIFSVADISGVPIMNVNSSGVSYFDGSLGIGTDSPKTKLNIVGGDVQLDSGQMLSFYTGASTGIQNNGIKGSDVDDSLRFYTGALERVTIKGANVGIGTITPGAKLDVEGSYGDVIKAVSGSQSITTNFVAPSGSSGLNNIISTAGRFNIGTSDAQPFSLLTNSISRIAILSDGKVGIGVTNPSYKLEVSGTLGVNRTDGIIFAGSAAGGYGNKITADTSNDFIFSTSLPSAPYTVSEKMRIANGGATTFTSTVTATNFILSSDERLKENVEKVCDNRVKADWKTFELKTEKGQKRYGVIAQELEKTNPEFVREDSQGFKSVAYIDLLIAKIAELEARLEKLEK